MPSAKSVDGTLSTVVTFAHDRDATRRTRHQSVNERASVLEAADADRQALEISIVDGRMEPIDSLKSI